MSARLPSGFENSTSSAGQASMVLPTPPANVSYVLTHVSAKLTAVSGPPASAQTYSLQVLDGATQILANRTLSIAGGALGVSDALDMDLNLRATPGNALTVRFSAAGLSGTQQDIAIAVTVA